MLLNMSSILANLKEDEDNSSPRVSALKHSVKSVASDDSGHGDEEIFEDSSQLTSKTSVFSKLEEEKASLEALLGFDRFLDAYR